jgi:hypothetical protein
MQSTAVVLHTNKMCVCLNAAQSLKTSQAIQRNATQGQLGCLLPVKLGYDRAARDLTVSTQASAAALQMFFIVRFYFLLLTHHKPQAAQSLLLNRLELAPQQPFSPFNVQLDRYQCHTPTAAGSNQLQMAR